MFKTMLATFVVKTGIGLYFIQEIKNIPFYEIYPFSRSLVFYISPIHNE